jgi:hypothetical protein
VLYSRWEPLDPAGIVVEVIHARSADPETGELCDETGFYLYAYWKSPNAWRHLPAGDVDTAQLSGLDAAAASTAARMLIKPVVLRRAYHRLTAAEIERIHQAAILAAAVAP